MCTAVSFDASSDCGRTFFMDILPKNVSNYLHVRFVDSCKEFLSCCRDNKRELGFVMPTGVPGVADLSILGHGRS